MNARMPKPLFYLLSLTWGLPMTMIGAVVAIVLMIMGYKPKKWNYCYYFEVGNNWGGVELGMFFLTDKSGSLRTRNHEHGHAIQNCYFGPLFPFIVAIPSAVRYWYRELVYSRKGKNPPTLYDDIWFEGSATKLGTELNEWLKMG